MGTGTTPSGSEVTLTNSASPFTNYAYPLTGFNVGAASTHCHITSTGFYCANPVNTGAGQPAVPVPTVNSGIVVAYRTTGGANTDFGFPSYLPAPLPSSQCVSTSSTQIISVTANTTYDFGCDFFVGPSSSPSGGFCTVSVMCY